MHLPFSAQGLFFLSGACISGSFFSFSSTYSLIAAMLLDNGQRSMDAWYFMFSICFFSASLSMAARILGSMAQNLNCYLQVDALSVKFAQGSFTPLNITSQYFLFKDILMYIKLPAAFVDKKSLNQRFLSNLILLVFELNSTSVKYTKIVYDN